MKTEIIGTMRFYLDDEFYVEVTPNIVGSLSFWMCHENIPIKSHMFMVDGDNIPPSEWENMVSDTEDMRKYINTFMDEIEACDYSDMLK